jgi:DNA polymerase III delta prime subunit
MSIFHLFKPKENEKNTYSFVEEDRNLSLDIRRSKSEIAKAKQQLELEVMKLEAERTKLQLQAEIEEAKQRILDLQNEDESGTSSNPADVMMMALLSKVMGGGNSQASTPLPPTPTVPMETPQINLSNDQIEDMWANIPKEIKKLARGMTEEQIGDFVSKQMPNINSESRTKIVLRAKRG